jgi:crotonobetainyl-CoA:carnitine CoA-transferase CaiB-like acyl-CoA transferase
MSAGSGEPAPAAGSLLPLAGLRVLDLTVVYAGPYLAMLLADLGAEVIRVENIHVWNVYTRGIEARPLKENVDADSGWPIGYPDHDPGERPWERFPWGLPLARNKKSVTINLLSEEGRAYFHRLVAKCDIMVENNAPSTIARLGITYEDLVKDRPDLVMLRAPAFGLSGARRDIRGFGSHIESFIGHSLLRGYEDSDPSRNQEMNSGDNATAGTGLFAILAALHHRDRTGRGQLIELAQAENSTHLFPQAVMEASLNGRNTTMKGNRDPSGAAPNGVYACMGEERWIAISVYTDDEWAALCGVLGRPELVCDPRFESADARRAHIEELDQLLDGAFGSLDAMAAMYRLQAGGVPAGAIHDPRDALQSPQLWARGFFERIHHRYTGTWEWPGPPFRLPGAPRPPSLPPPGLGEHNAYVYKTLLGVSDAGYEGLLARNEIGTVYDEGIG